MRTPMIAALALSASAHAGTTLFTQPPTSLNASPGWFSNANAPGGSADGNVRVADNFTLAVGGDVESITWYGSTILPPGSSFLGLSNVHAFNAEFFTSTGSGVGSLIDSQQVLFADVARTQVGTGSLNNPIYRFEAELPVGVPLDAGVETWLSINAELITPGSDVFVWLDTGLGDNDVIDFDPFVNNVWIGATQFNNRGDLAFTLAGTPVPAPLTLVPLAVAAVRRPRRSPGPTGARVPASRLA